MKLFHFSEDPNIRLFEPRQSRPLPRLPADVRLVWAIDEWHSPMYFFPRECPRVLLWALNDSLPEDVEMWMGPGDFRMVAYVEQQWIEKVENCELYRYSFDAESFVDIRDAGFHVSRQALEPVAVEAMGRLPEQLMAAQVDLRPVDSLQPFADARVWESSLHFSGIKLHNARGWRLQE
jgi:hypothetical protein